MIDWRVLEGRIISAKGMAFTASACNDLRGPGVYVLLGARDLPLYVGSSRNVAMRAFSRDHKQYTKAIHAYHRLLVYPCFSLQAAQEAEAILIAVLKPLYNHSRKAACRTAFRLGIMIAR